MEWQLGTDESLQKVSSELSSYTLTVPAALRRFHHTSPQKITERMVDNTVLALECDRSPRHSIFLLSAGSAKTSAILGKSMRDSVRDLEADWKFLKEKLKEAGIWHSVKSKRIVINDESLESAISWISYLKRKETIKFLLFPSGAGIITNFVCYLWSRPPDLATLIASFVGFIIGFLFILLSHPGETKYEFKGV